MTLLDKLILLTVIINPYKIINTIFMKSKKILKILSLILGGLILTGVISAFLIVLSIDFIDLDKEKIDDIGKTIEVLADDMTPMEYNGQNGNTVKISDLPKYVPQAFIAIEDKRFYKHNGIDYIRVMGAFLNDLKTFSFKEGASTISQQLIKNTHLSNERTLERKLKEIHITRQLEKKYSKDEILEKYLNIIYFGNGLYGIESASNVYFGKPSKNLEVNETAALAAIINSPASYNPYKNSEKLISRQKIVLKAMLDNNFIDKVQYENAIKAPLNFSFKQYKNSQSIYSKLAVSESIKLLKGLKQNLTDCVIHTYFNNEVQNALLNGFDDFMPKTINKYGIIPDYAGIVIDNNSFGIAGLISSYDDILNIKRQPASTIKPLAVYTPALQNNLITTASLVLDEPVNYDGYNPKNYNGKHLGWISIRDAVSTSNNIAAVKVLKTVGIDTSTEFLNDIGIKLDEHDNGLSLALGGLHNGVTLYDLAQAYTAFPNYGLYQKSTFIKKIQTKDGTVIYQNRYNPKRVINEDTAYIMTDMLKSAVNNGTAKKLKNCDYAVAAKTGTNSYLKTNKNNDAYCLSYTTKHTMGVWLGNLSNEEESALSFNVTGGTFPTIITKKVYDTLYKNNKPLDFERPKTVIYADIDLLEYKSNKTLALANAQLAPRYKKKEIFSIKNMPPKAINIKWDIVQKSEEIQKKKESFLDKMLEIFKKRKYSNE